MDFFRNWCNTVLLDKYVFYRNEVDVHANNYFTKSLWDKKKSKLERLSKLRNKELKTAEDLEEIADIEALLQRVSAIAEAEASAQADKEGSTQEEEPEQSQQPVVITSVVMTSSDESDVTEIASSQSTPVKRTPPSSKGKGKKKK